MLAHPGHIGLVGAKTCVDQGNLHLCQQTNLTRVVEVARADHRRIPPFHLPRQGGDGGQGCKIRLIKQAPCKRGQAAGGQPLLPGLPLIKLAGRVSPQRLSGV